MNIKKLLEGTLYKSDLKELLDISSKSIDKINNKVKGVVDFVNRIKDVSISFNELNSIGSYKDLIEVSKKENLLVLSSKKCSLSYSIHDDLPDILGFDFFKKIINQLISNAIIHAFEIDKSNKINIDVSYTDKRKILINFMDNGKGIPKEVLKNIFDPFYSFTNDEQVGNGTGLYIVYKLVTEVLGGEITCHSLLGQGSHFEIVLPNGYEYALNN